MERILLYGATGRTGKLVLKYALEQGYEVTALARNPDKINLKSDRLKIIKGSPEDPEDVRSAIQDCKVVISTLSAFAESEVLSLKKVQTRNTLEKAISNSIISMKEQHIKKIISLSSIGAGSSYKYAPWYMKLMIKISNFKFVFADHNAQERLLMNSGLDWIIVRPVALNDKTEIKDWAVTYNNTPSPFKISRNTVAKFIIDSVQSNEFVYKAPILSEKK
ncbi:NAD(P)-dependent oxidoreductase [Flavobacterium sp. HTF]|uniref:NAD(P)-dependent oxidoreductase n=1 Tax=Flavobacterium sp. HTF TaxID=2170732 RepID=UPI000D5E6394|nr:NAD(P)-binding oxidoreductase [Flavobacterium sp. HTF]PWB27193.1 epimerase [Flavobacterium sp. HTF]